METKSAVEEREEYQPCKLVVLNRKEQLRSKRGYCALRRAQDIFFSAIAILLLLPIMLIVALIIFLDDPHGSPIFAQNRCGRDGKLFKMYKFRSMYVDAEDLLTDLLNLLKDFQHLLPVDFFFNQPKKIRRVPKLCHLF